ncbi:MAG: A/G-specific adenine glycosylase [Clostridia bacterium]|nr:A/G-specific adenine glycosylase [Clostridia bacterium]
MKKLTPYMISLLLDWYGENKRTLPWRGSADPYRVWVSEIMLQQTRVEAARDYFMRWMNRFPTVKSLAAADEEEVLKAWEGLGYYSRARNLHRAAKIVADEYDGTLPADKEKLRALPGIGAYTVGAILSIAFGIPEPAVDGNVLRVYSRLTKEAFDQSRDDVRREIADGLRPLMPAGKTSDFTQSLFELGALICLPNAIPRCDECPLKELCAAHKAGAETDYPIPVVKGEKRREALTVLVLSYKGKFAVRKRGDRGLLAGLWELPNLQGALTASEVSRLYAGEVAPLPAANHIFTHIVWEMTGYRVELDERPDDPTLVFVTPEEMKEAYPLPSAFRAYKKHCSALR